MHWVFSIVACALLVACGQSHPKAKTPSPVPSASPAASEAAPVGRPIRIEATDLPTTDQNQFFYVFPAVTGHAVKQVLQSQSGQLSPEATRSWCLRLRLHPLTHADRKELAQRIGVKDRWKGYFQLPWPSEPAHSEPTRAETASSFVIDYDDPRFIEVWKRVVAKWGEHPDPEKLEAFVASYVDVKTTTRRFDTASEVAESHMGDCSEHAVLLAALLRKSGKAARLVTGLLVVVEDKSVGAFGHAWTEWNESGRWNIADAAMHPVPGQSGTSLRAKRYIPVLRMVDEGPGFNAAMDKVRSIEAVSGVEVDTCSAAAR